jgi:hypothetical protein
MNICVIYLNVIDDLNSAYSKTAVISIRHYDVAVIDWVILGTTQNMRTICNCYHIGRILLCPFSIIVFPLNEI